LRGQNNSVAIFWEKTTDAESDIAMNNIEVRMISEPPTSDCMKKAESDIMSDFGLNFSLISKHCNAYVCLSVSVFFSCSCNMSVNADVIIDIDTDMDMDMDMDMDIFERKMVDIRNLMDPTILSPYFLFKLSFVCYCTCAGRFLQIFTLFSTVV
jgi:hypothetical protein